MKTFPSQVHVEHWQQPPIQKAMEDLCQHVERSSGSDSSLSSLSEALFLGEICYEVELVEQHVVQHFGSR
jgi:hypothetical protein